MAKHEAPRRHARPVREPRAPRPGSKKVRRAVAAALICALVLGGAGVGGYHYLQHRSGKAVNVYPLSQLSTTDSWYDRVQTGGQVRADRMQSVYLSSTQTVTEVFVEEGQQIRAGDPILAFDTTLDEVELTRKQIDIEQRKLDLQEAQKDLEEINNYKVGSPGGGGFSLPEATAEPASPAPTTVPYFQGGSGTAGDPYVFLWSPDFTFSNQQVEQLLLLAQPTPTPEPSPSASPSASPDASPNASPEPGETGGETETAAAPARFQGEPVPVGAGQTVAVRRLLAPVHSLREPDPIGADGGQTGEPTASAEPTETAGPEETDPNGSAGPEGSTSTPSENRFQGMTTAQEIMDWFLAGETGEEKQALYISLTDEEKDTIASIMTDDQLAALTELLRTAGVADAVFPASARTPEPQETGGNENEAGGDSGNGSSGNNGPNGGGDTEGGSGAPEQQPSPSPTAGPAGAEYYMVFEIRDNDSMQGDILQVFELEFILSKSMMGRYSWNFRVLDPSYEPQLSWEPDDGFDYGYYGGFDATVYYSATEIEQMRTATQRKITNLTLQLKKAEQELKQVEFELSNGEVLCTTDGVVKSVLDPDEAREQEKPVVMISGGGGYYITAYMSEFDMDRMHVGDTVTVNNYMTGEELDAAITEISRYPAEGSQADYYSQSGNSNASKYPFTVEVGEDADLREGNYVSVYFSASGRPAEEEEEAGSFYLENAFLRTENGRSYVYLAGPDGLLEKRYVSTGASLYGVLTEITGGLDMDTDYIAFPYGRSVKAGARTVVQENIDALYGY